MTRNTANRRERAGRPASAAAAAVAVAGALLGLGAPALAEGDIEAAATALAAAHAAERQGVPGEALTRARQAIEQAPPGAKGYGIRLGAQAVLARVHAGSGEPDLLRNQKHQRCMWCVRSASWSRCPECKGKGTVRKIPKTNRRLTAEDIKISECRECKGTGAEICVKCAGFEAACDDVKKFESAVRKILSVATASAVIDGKTTVGNVIERVDQIVLKDELPELHPIAESPYGSSALVRDGLGNAPIAGPTDGAEAFFKDGDFRARSNFAINWATEVSRRLTRLRKMEQGRTVTLPADGEEWPAPIGAHEVASRVDNGWPLVTIHGIIVPTPLDARLPAATYAGSPALIGLPDDPHRKNQTYQTHERVGLISGGEHDLAVIAWTSDTKVELERLSNSRGAKWLGHQLEHYDFETASRLRVTLNTSIGSEVSLTGRVLGPFKEPPRFIFEVWAIGDPVHKDLLIALAEAVDLEVTDKPAKELFGDQVLIGRRLAPIDGVGDAKVTLAISQTLRGEALAQAAAAAGITLGVRGDRIVGDASEEEALLFERLRHESAALLEHERTLRDAGLRGMTIQGYMEALDGVRREANLPAAEKVPPRSGPAPASEPEPAGGDEPGEVETPTEEPVVEKPAVEKKEPKRGLFPAKPDQPKADTEKIEKTNAFLAGYLKAKASVNEEGITTVSYDFDKYLQIDDFIVSGFDNYDVSGGKFQMTNGDFAVGRVVHRLPFEGKVEIRARVTLWTYSKPKSHFAVSFFEPDPVQQAHHVVELFVPPAGKFAGRLAARSAHIDEEGTRHDHDKVVSDPHKAFKEGETYQIVIEADASERAVLQDGRAILSAKITSEKPNGFIGFEILDAKVMLERLEIRGKIDSKWLEEQLR